MLLITGAHVRAARALLNMEQTRLAAEAGVSSVTLRKLEQGGAEYEPRLSTIQAVHAALAKHGIEFLNDDQPGVRLRLMPRAEAA